MLTGEVEHSLDSRGRLAIPRRFRGKFEEDGGFLTRSIEGCLLLYPYEEWRSIERKLRRIPMTDLDGHVLKKFFTIGFRVSLDGQGRILVPPALKSYAGIESEVVLLGVTDVIEIWAKDRWVRYQDEQFQTERLVERARAHGIGQPREEAEEE